MEFQINGTKLCFWQYVYHVSAFFILTIIAFLFLLIAFIFLCISTIFRFVLTSLERASRKIVNVLDMWR